MEAGSLNARLKRKLADLGKALSEAIAESPLASRHLAELREEGYSVYLLLESDGDKVARGGPALAGRQRGEQRRLPGRTPAPVDRQLEAAPPPLPEPAFLIDGRDLAFLRSVGIDPTRPARRRKA